VPTSSAQVGAKERISHPPGGERYVLSRLYRPRAWADPGKNVPATLWQKHHGFPFIVPSAKRVFTHNGPQHRIRIKVAESERIME